ADRGEGYRPVIYYSNEEERQIAEQSKKNLEENGPFNEPIVTSIEPREPFYAAEDYHQDFYKKESAHYKRYSVGSGRVPFLEKQNNLSMRHKTNIKTFIRKNLPIIKDIVLDQDECHF